MTDTPIVDQFRDFAAQETEIRVGILAASALRKRILDHDNEARTWAEIIAAP